MERIILAIRCWNGALPVDVRIPPLLRKFTSGSSAVSVSGATVFDVIESLNQQHPGFKSQITDDDGQLHRFINLYRNGEDIRYLSQLGTEVKDGDVVAILPAVAGGARRA